MDEKEWKKQTKRAAVKVFEKYSEKIEERLLEVFDELDPVNVDVHIDQVKRARSLIQKAIQSIENAE